jgi:hypothetical protein
MSVNFGSSVNLISFVIRFDVGAQKTVTKNREFGGGV